MKINKIFTSAAQNEVLRHQCAGPALALPCFVLRIVCYSLLLLVCIRVVRRHRIMNNESFLGRGDEIVLLDVLTRERSAAIRW